MTYEEKLRFDEANKKFMKELKEMRFTESKITDKLKKAVVGAMIAASLLGGVALHAQGGPTGMEAYRNLQSQARAERMAAVGGNGTYVDEGIQKKNFENNAKSIIVQILNQKVEDGENVNRDYIKSVINDFENWGKDIMLSCAKNDVAKDQVNNFFKGLDVSFDDSAQHINDAIVFNYAESKKQFFDRLLRMC